MATIKKEITTLTKPDAVWERIRDIGALHTRLVPGFVVDTRLDGDARWVTFANGMVVKEPIVTIDEAERRLVWSAESPNLKHYNSSIQVFPAENGSRLVWLSDLLPNEAAAQVGAMMDQGMQAMQTALGR
ncbi:MAG: SRPBCC family protein [Myxococcota bacterium]